MTAARLPDSSPTRRSSERPAARHPAARLSRRPVEPTPESELLADLGFDSLRVLELVGELEDHFNIAVPLNALTHIRTVGQIAAEVRRLAALPEGRAARAATEGHLA